MRSPRAMNALVAQWISIRCGKPRYKKCECFECKLYQDVYKRLHNFCVSSDTQLGFFSLSHPPNKQRNADIAMENAMIGCATFEHRLHRHESIP